MYVSVRDLLNDDDLVSLKQYMDAANDEGDLNLKNNPIISKDIINKLVDAGAIRYGSRGVYHLTGFGDLAFYVLSLWVEEMKERKNDLLSKP